MYKVKKSLGTYQLLALGALASTGALVALTVIACNLEFIARILPKLCITGLGEIPVPDSLKDE